MDNLITTSISTNIIEQINRGNPSGFYSIPQEIRNPQIEYYEFTNLPIYEHKPFIEANTQEIDLSVLQQDCIIPVFSKDNEKTIAHQEFIEIALECASLAFPTHSFSSSEIRVSHQIKGRVPEAIHKNAKDLLEHEKTQYFERMAFIIKIPSITETINGNELCLTLGGVRAYNQENLYNKKSFEKFKFFIGFQNLVCCNLCVSSDGFVSEMRVSSYQELQAKILEVILNYKAEKHLKGLRDFTNYSITESQFAQLIGKARLYNHLPKSTKLELPELTFNDGQFNTIARDFYQDDSFCKDPDGDINLWSVFNLFTQANKSSYIDTFLERNLNAYEFNQGICKALDGDKGYQWFLS